MKKGFTLVEVIACVAIIAVLSIIVVPIVLTTISDNKEKLYKEAENRVKEAALKYITDNYYDSSVSSIRVELSDLKSAGLIDTVVDLTDNSVCDGYVLITDLDTDLNAKAYISCSNYETSGYIH